MSIRFFPQTAAGALALSACFASAPAFAAAQSFVSVKGTDAGTCALPTAPCRTFAYAHNQTSAGGEILALDAGDYGPVTITKSLSITGAVEGAGVRGGPANGDAITITAGANAVVDLTGLTLDGLGSVSNGVLVVSGLGTSKRFVTVRNCVIRNYLGMGVAAMRGRLLVENVFISNTGDNAITVVDQGVIHRVSINGAGAAGIDARGGSRDTISDATITGGNVGVDVSPFLMLNRSVVTGNAIGLNDVARSAGDNFIRDNGTNFPNGAPTVVGKQ